MSVVAWDGQTLAADRQVTLGNTRFTCSKIKRLANGVLLAGAGSLAQTEELFDWYENGADVNKYPESQTDRENFSNFLVVRDGRVYHYSWSAYPYEIQDKFFAVGSGMDYAIGAMAMGADAIKAVEVASKFDINCGMGVDWFEIGKKKVSAKTEKTEG